MLMELEWLIWMEHYFKKMKKKRLNGYSYRQSKQKANMLNIRLANVTGMEFIFEEISFVLMLG